MRMTIMMRMMKKMNTKIDLGKSAVYNIFDINIDVVPYKSIKGVLEYSLYSRMTDEFDDEFDVIDVIPFRCSMVLYGEIIED